MPKSQSTAPRVFLAGQIYAGVVDHPHGTNLYLGDSEGEIYQQVYRKFVREYWTIEGVSRNRPPSKVTDDEAKSHCAQYFEHVTTEGLTMISPDTISTSVEESS